jgi:hypothetical protein
MIFANAIGSLTMLLNAIATELALSDKDKADIFPRTSSRRIRILTERLT